MENKNSQVLAGASGASGGAWQQNPPVLKAKEVVEVERTPSGVRFIRKIVMVDTLTEKFVRELCLPCDEEWYAEIYGDDPSCVCEKNISIIDEVTLPPETEVL